MPYLRKLSRKGRSARTEVHLKRQPRAVGEAQGTLVKLKIYHFCVNLCRAKTQPWVDALLRAAGPTMKLIGNDPSADNEEVETEAFDLKTTIPSQQNIHASHPCRGATNEDGLGRQAQRARDGERCGAEYAEAGNHPGWL